MMGKYNEAFVKMCELDYEELEELIKDGITQFKIKTYDEGYKQGKFDQHMDSALDSVKKVVEEKTAQERRDEIVEWAKKDVTELTKYNVRTIENDEGISFMHFVVREEFIENKKKRTVVCLLKGANNSTLYSKGIAKCAPNDCFNVHIGKAIALRRALGLEVLNEYINTPQPTAVRVGDRIRMKYYSPHGYRDVEFYERIIKEFDGDKVRYGGESFDYRESVDKGAKIIDDSREED